MAHQNSRKMRGSGVKKAPLTHFLCIPVVTVTSRPQLEQSFRQFRSMVCLVNTTSPSSTASRSKTESGSIKDAMRVVHPKAVRPIGSLHLTLGVMSLSRDQLREAKAFLESLDMESILDRVQPGTQTSDTSSDSRAIRVDFKGLLSMHNPTSTSILYCAPRDPTRRLYPFCLEVQRLFREHGFLVPDDRQLKLHATVVNTIYAKGRMQRGREKAPPKIPADSSKPAISIAEPDELPSPMNTSQGHGPNANAPLKIDATAILETHKEFVWAEDVRLGHLCICEMGAKKINDASGTVIDERYTEVVRVSLPS